MKVIVLGAGVIGVTTAYFLARAGHQVIVLEKNTAAGLGCSYANGGQLSYSHVETWADRASLLSMARAAFLPGSFLSISNFGGKNFFKWLREFYKNSLPEIARDNSEKLFALSSHSREVLQWIIAEENNLKFNYKNTGTLHFYCNQKKFDLAIKEAEFYDSIGCEVQVLNIEECVKKEPTLVKLFDEKKLIGGIFYESDASGNCALFTQELSKICQEKYGVVFEYGTEVRNIFTNYKKITGINSSKGVYVGHKYVYALGALGNSLLEGIKINSKIYPLKGYSLSIQANKEFIAPNMAVTDCENRIVYSRIGEVFRAAGTIEICGLKANKNKRHLKFLKNKVKATFSDFGNFNQVSEWFGFRPFRPNSIPLICEVKKYENLLINSGHGSLGWTLSAASGKILADLISDNDGKRFRFLEEEEKEIYL